MLKTKILNSKGEPIVLNDMEERIAKKNQEIVNTFGYEIDITTLTAIQKRVVEQKFFEVAPADYLPLRVGNGAWNSQILTYRSFSIAGDFESGIINTAAANSRLAQADTAVDSVTNKILNWAKEIQWSLFDLKMAAQSGNWDLVSSKEKSRKKNWDLGIQKIAFLGSEMDTDVDGLLNQSDVTSNLTVITEYINGMSTSELDAFVAAVYEAYRSNCNRTARPTHFIIPESDYNGLANFPDSTYPLKNRLTILTEAFRVLTQNPNFKILPLSYADQATNADSINKNRYVLLNYDEDSLRMDIPVDYTATLANTVNSFQYQNVGYGQFTGVKAYRPAEMLYFDWAT